MRVILQKAIRELALAALFFLPADRRRRIERWLRGRADKALLDRADCVVVSYGKAGRTWLRVMISRFYQAKHGLPEGRLMGFDNFHNRNPAIPRIFFTHDNYLKDYTGNHQDKRDYRSRKVVLLVRHPADNAVSQFFQWKYRMRAAKKALNDYPAHDAEVGIFDFVMDREAGMPKIVEFMNLWAREAAERDDLLVVRYEDLRQDTQANLGRIMAFIGTPGDAETLQDAVDYASFDNMKKLEEKHTFWLAGTRMKPKDRANPNSYKVRRAKVGGYRDYFDDEQIATIEAYISDHLSPLYGYAETAASDGSDRVDRASG